MVDKEILKSRLTLLAEYISDLEDVSEITLNEFLKDKVKRRFVERTLQLAIEACLDIGSHLISDLQLREPEKNRDIFIILVENDILAEQARENFVAMAGFRNIIVHDYARLDPEIVYLSLQWGISDLKYFVRTISENIY
ncbi:MAG: DUF86 domain-containing protein [Dethiobacter sp.]|nr:DUF86 domain-containing protein [Dethiobacter sp.]MBS3901134.1 DUF86 domain-containing protein [Dethiobacter sp.]MBS3989074.1 DUF86 domain-containing protein [Dethiobacter sp.]